MGGKGLGCRYTLEHKAENVTHGKSIMRVIVLAEIDRVICAGSNSVHSLTLSLESSQTFSKANRKVSIHPDRSPMSHTVLCQVCDVAVDSGGGMTRLVVGWKKQLRIYGFAHKDNEFTLLQKLVIPQPPMGIASLVMPCHPLNFVPAMAVAERNIIFASENRYCLISQDTGMPMELVSSANMRHPIVTKYIHPLPVQGYLGLLRHVGLADVQTIFMMFDERLAGWRMANGFCLGLKWGL